MTRSTLPSGLANTPRLNLTVYPSWRDAPWDHKAWPSFSPRELACKGTGRLAIHPPTLDKLQALRTRLGRPVILNSAYRSPEHNRRIGGAKGSWHLDAVAYDVRMDNHDPAHFIRTARALGFTGIGTYPKSNFVHIDTRADFGATPWDWGEMFPVNTEPFSAPEAVPQPPATPVGRAGIAATAAGVAVAAREATPAIEAVQGLSETAQIALLVGAGLIAVALIVWGPDGVRAALRRWRGGEDL